MTHPAGTCNWAGCQRQECRDDPFPGSDWTDLRWCQYCDTVRGHTCMEFTHGGLYICSVCVQGAPPSRRGPIPKPANSRVRR